MNKNTNNKSKGKTKKPKPKWSSKFNPNAFKYQDLDLSVYGRHVIGFKTVFNEYLEDIEVYTKKASDVQAYSIAS